LDGHHRIQIAEDLGLPFRTTHRSFPSRTEVTLWIFEHQLGRRNLTNKQRSYYRGKLYAKSKQQGKRTDLTSAQNEQKSDTAKRIGEMDGVSGSTVRRDEKYADAIDTLEQDGIPREEMTGSRPVFSKSDTKALARMEPEARREAADKIRRGDAKNVRDATRQSEQRHEQKRQNVAPDLDGVQTADDIVSEIVTQVARLFLPDKAQSIHDFRKEKHKFTSEQRTKVARQLRNTAERFRRMADDIAA
jgi:hypothetical protein